MTAQLVMIFLSIVLVWAIFGNPTEKVEATPKKEKYVAPLEEGEEPTEAVKKILKGPPTQVNHYSKQESSLATDTFKRLKEKSNVRFD